MTRVIHAPNNVLAPNDQGTQTFRVNVELSTYYREHTRKKFLEPTKSIFKIRKPIYNHYLDYSARIQAIKLVKVVISQLVLLSMLEFAIQLNLTFTFALMPVSRYCPPGSMDP